MFRLQVLTINTFMIFMYVFYNAIVGLSESEILSDGPLPAPTGSSIVMAPGSNLSGAYSANVPAGVSCAVKYVKLFSWLLNFSPCVY